MAIQKNNFMCMIVSGLIIKMGFLLQHSMLRTQASITNDTACPPEITTDCNLVIAHVRANDSVLCGNDKMCKEYHDIMTHHVYIHPDLEVRNVTRFSNNRPTTTIEYFEPFAYVSSDCPTDVSSRRLNSQLANESGFSPWQYVINSDCNRIPENILETRCECRDCLNAAKDGHTRDYETRALMVTRYFRMKNNANTIFNAQFSYGCICEYAEENRK